MRIVIALIGFVIGVVMTRFGSEGTSALALASTLIGIVLVYGSGLWMMTLLSRIRASR